VRTTGSFYSWNGPALPCMSSVKHMFLLPLPCPGCPAVQAIRFTPTVFYMRSESAWRWYGGEATEVVVPSHLARVRGLQACVQCARVRRQRQEHNRA